MKIKQWFLASGMLLGVSGAMAAERVCGEEGDASFSLYELDNDTFICLRGTDDGYMDEDNNQYNTEFEKLDEYGKTKWEKSFQIFSKKPLYFCDNKALSWETNSCNQKCSGWCNNSRYCDSGKVYDYYDCVQIDIPAP